MNNVKLMNIQFLSSWVVKVVFSLVIPIILLPILKIRTVPTYSRSCSHLLLHLLLVPIKCKKKYRNKSFCSFKVYYTYKATKHIEIVFNSLLNLSLFVSPAVDQNTSSWLHFNFPALSCSRLALLCRSQWRCGVKRESAADRLLGLPVRNPQGAWISVCYECCISWQAEVSTTARLFVQLSPTDCSLSKWGY
jgi:hypothetical protein